MRSAKHHGRHYALWIPAGLCQEMRTMTGGSFKFLSHLGQSHAIANVSEQRRVAGDSR
jgi:hypothetical protein